MSLTERIIGTVVCGLLLVICLPIYVRLEVLARRGRLTAQSQPGRLWATGEEKPWLS